MDNMEDERVYPVCGLLIGNGFETNRFPGSRPIPIAVARAWALVICGGALGAKAAAEPAACIIPPQTIDEQAKAKAAVDAKLKEHKIGLLRTKDDLVQLLGQKQASLKQALQLMDQPEKISPSGGLHDLAVVELQGMAKAKGVSLNMTTQAIINLLDEMEPRMADRPAQEQAAAYQGAGKRGR